MNLPGEKMDPSRPLGALGVVYYTYTFYNIFVKLLSLN